MPLSSRAFFVNPISSKEEPSFHVCLALALSKTFRFVKAIGLTCMIDVQDPACFPVTMSFKSFSYVYEKQRFRGADST